MSGAYDYYLARMSGGRPQWTGDNPQSGLFRHFSGEPARIQRDKATGEMVAFLGSEAVDPVWLWPSVAERCVSKADYLARVDSGAWPGEHPVTQEPAADLHGQPGHNSGATVSEFDQLREDAETRLQDAEKLLFSVGDAVKPGDEATASKLKDEATFIDSKLKPLEALRKAEKKPHDDAASAVQAKFKPILDKLDAAKRKLLMRVDAWTRAEDKRRRDEHAKAVAEANRKAAELQVANKAAEPVVVEAPPPPAPIKIGTIGDKRGVRKIKMRADITDWAAAISDPLVAEDPAVRAAAQKIADKLADINATKPWFNRVEA
jgi:hypothetical protein